MGRGAWGRGGAGGFQHFDFADAIEVVVVRDKDLHARVSREVFDFPGHQHHVDEDDDSAAHQRAVVGEQKLGTVGQHDADAIALVEPEPEKPRDDRGNGEVIGVNSSIFSRSGGSEGLGFAIPIDRVRRVGRDLVESGSVRHAWIGAEVEPAALESRRLILPSADGRFAVLSEEREAAEEAEEGSSRAPTLRPKPVSRSCGSRRSPHPSSGTTSRGAPSDLGERSPLWTAGRVNGFTHATRLAKKDGRSRWKFSVHHKQLLKDLSL